MEIIANTKFYKSQASVDALSEHPLAQAIVNGAREKGVTIKNVIDFEAVTGKGVIASLDGNSVSLGNLKLLNDFDMQLDSQKLKVVLELQASGQTVMFLVVNDTIEGILTVADLIKESSSQAVKTLQSQGVLKLL